jgi:hypothetical protein
MKKYCLSTSNSQNVDILCKVKSYQHLKFLIQYLDIKIIESY